MDEIKLLNYLKGLSDNEECAEVESWSMESDKNKKRLEELYFILCLNERHAAIKSIDLDRSFEQLYSRIENRQTTISRSKRSSLKRWTGIAAAFVVGVLCAASLFYSASMTDKEYDMTVSTAPRQRAQVVLPDGSKVWLNASTSLSYKGSWLRKERMVILDGEAYFEVKRNEESPFVVHSKKIRTEVLGTKFNVKAKVDEEGVTTTLLEGSVRVVLPNQCRDDGFVLHPGQSVKVNAETYRSELKDLVSANDVLLWIDGRIDFKEATLWEITQRLERYYDVKFEFKDEQLKKECFTCLFHTDDKIEEIMSALMLTKRFRSKMENDKIILSLR